MRRYPAKPDKVYFFGTCLVDMAFPQAGMAGIKLIQREGVKVIFPQEQSCCGQPAYNSGFMKETKRVARKQVKIFSKNYPIVVPSGSCAGMMKHHYPKLFRDDPDFETVQNFASRIFELSEFLLHVLNITLIDQGTPVRAAWHSSCHANREMGIIDDCKQLIRQLKNVELVELENENECCGFGGTFSVKQPQISAAMVQDKVKDIQQTGASIVLAENCACLMNISGHMEFMHIPITSKHIAEFIWERINGQAK